MRVSIRESPPHRTLVAFEHVDHGDPALVACELKDQVLEDWSAWMDGSEELPEGHSSVAAELD